MLIVYLSYNWIETLKPKVIIAIESIIFSHLNHKDYSSVQFDDLYTWFWHI